MKRRAGHENKGDTERTQPGIDRLEVRKFAALADEWWDTSGPMAPLHAINPWRIGAIRAAACRHFGVDPEARAPLEGRSLLDVGCGAGLLCEPMARLGASVTGIDPAREVIEVARLHAAGQELPITYRAGTVEEVVRSGQRFDLVTALEVVEHSEDQAEFVRAAAACVADGGLLVLSTLARTNRAWLEAIVAAEYLLRWLPAGTHDWRRFVKASELARMVRAAGLTVQEVRSVRYEAGTGRFVDAPRPDVNYLMVAARC
ncbi:bifunctional 2-polyprenyl-6-hydroxyphenol methylase/3-demethylubiquinol 3-O-methyltransferase UbiG [Geminicoccus roseus]|uniref:bifunctional 2-polyprenyl-6-hydroxyphenol methylase/3-demethylubiquinol 3-O-methyltransferase UbiG n=1 Tax=Geminicoccus roseus TaxID=404900 RepID=UPI00041815F4|nr:bifunctional 2-polyprenyl-6-hydroxyphenol methylase/3-demethylubiquinol 3-O-methyltransferase UbiG [Geminicoccus roseus]